MVSFEKAYFCVHKSMTTKSCPENGCNDNLIVDLPLVGQVP